MSLGTENNLRIRASVSLRKRDCVVCNEIHVGVVHNMTAFLFGYLQ